MDLNYKGKTALVTGASSGLGKAIAGRLAEEGAHVVLVARREDLLREAVDIIKSQGGSAEYIACDLALEETPAKLSTQIREKFGHIHLLVNNAGREQLSPLQATSPKVIHEIVQLNLVAVICLTRCFLGLLKEGSSVVNLSSTTAILGAPGSAIYSATKGALISFTQSMARELAPRKVRINAVAPGQVQTDMLDRVLARVNPDQRAALEAAHPLGFGDPMDVAAAVAFLGSAQAKWITGHVLVVDGGLTA